MTLALDFTEAEVRALRERVLPHPALGRIRLSCDLALDGRAKMAECVSLQAAIAAMRAEAAR